MEVSVGTSLLKRVPSSCSRSGLRDTAVTASSSLRSASARLGIDLDMSEGTLRSNLLLSTALAQIASRARSPTTAFAKDANVECMRCSRARRLRPAACPAVTSAPALGCGSMGPGAERTVSRLSANKPLCTSEMAGCKLAADCVRIESMVPPRPPAGTGPEALDLAASAAASIRGSSLTSRLAALTCAGVRWPLARSSSCSGSLPWASRARGPCRSAPVSRAISRMVLQSPLVAAWRKARVASLLSFAARARSAPGGARDPLIARL
mmetsp:Transcript_65262/g.182130  ORF Transcript_65262/g.182130 Transcript_65262/m.182130 type:complete len:266 (-) Transcript_65262:3-800(-)